MLTEYQKHARSLNCDHARAKRFAEHQQIIRLRARVGDHPLRVNPSCGRQAVFGFLVVDGERAHGALAVSEGPSLRLTRQLYTLTRKDVRPSVASLA